MESEQQSNSVSVNMVSRRSLFIGVWVIVLLIGVIFFYNNRTINSVTTSPITTSSTLRTEGAASTTATLQTATTSKPITCTNLSCLMKALDANCSPATLRYVLVTNVSVVLGIPFKVNSPVKYEIQGPGAAGLCKIRETYLPGKTVVYDKNDISKLEGSEKTRVQSLADQITEDTSDNGKVRACLGSSATLGLFIKLLIDGDIARKEMPYTTTCEVL